MKKENCKEWWTTIGKINEKRMLNPCDHQPKHNSSHTIVPILFVTSHTKGIWKMIMLSNKTQIMVLCGLCLLIMISTRMRFLWRVIKRHEHSNKNCQSFSIYYCTNIQENHNSVLSFQSSKLKVWQVDLWQVDWHKLASKYKLKHNWRQLIKNT